MNKESGMPSDLKVVGESLHDLLTTLRTMYIHYQNLHWESKGANFYGDHLMFERMYQAVIPETDALAEKILGLTGEGRWLSPIHMVQHSHDVLSLWYDMDTNGAGRALFSELYLLEQLDYISGRLEESDSMTYGLDDLLSGIASKHEEHVYLLRQRLHTKTASAGKYFFDSPNKKEVTQFHRSKAQSNLKPSCSIKNETCTPPTPSDIIKEKGREFSTLSRYVVDTSQPTEKPMPQSHKELPKQAGRVRLTRRTK